ncbi:MAG: hypothetical protein JWQ63_3029 [Mucilaginibacter sp.]|jgi:hypothetical protein|nr:hypothetical protein [Mucilaginibacter sp.]
MSFLSIVTHDVFVFELKKGVMVLEPRAQRHDANALVPMHIVQATPSASRASA